VCAQTTAPPDVAGETVARPRRRRQSLPPSVWETWDDERLLDLRLCDLGLRIRGTELEQRIAELGRELEDRGLRFRPHYWLSDEWFCPDGVPGIAIPFYLAHPRLARLELHQMLEVEGGTPDWCLKILRHEAGHAIENAFGLRRRRRRQRLFGKSSQRYPDHYTARPYSRRYVEHLEAWYAQSHPDEDFAETFAVWLAPGSDWRTRYQGWPALRKLEYVDELMNEIKGFPPRAGRRQRPDALASLKKTLREHYFRMRSHYGGHKEDIYDRDLTRLFSTAPEHAGNLKASLFLSRLRRPVLRRVRRWTGEYLYTIDQVMSDMIARCRELNLRLTGAPAEAELEFTSLLTAQTMKYLHSGRHRLPL
jgi:hypothetical protein